MASEESAEMANCTITWIIENVSYCWQEKGDMIKSHLFVADTLENTKWRLWFYPRGNKNGNYVGYFLQREDDDDGIEIIEVDCELTFLAADGSVLNQVERNKRTFKRFERWGRDEFIKPEYVYAVKRSVYQPQDSLTARCRIWKSNKDTMETSQFFAKTIIQVERQSFAWVIKNFSSRGSDQKNTIIVKSASGVVLLTCDLHLTGGLCFEELVNIDIVPSDKRMKSLNFQTFFVNSNGIKTPFGKKEFIVDDLRKRDFTLLLSKKQMIEQKSLYLPNDILTLNCECAFSTGVASEVFEIIDFGNNPPHTKKNVTNVNEHAEERPSNTLLDGIQMLRKNVVLCDTKLCTRTETFPVHSVLLSAASPVFKAMFTTDMKEKVKESVDIPDVDAGTLSRMLHYVYTDNLECRDWDWENASLLYAAADKYQMKSLRILCSFYLKNIFHPTNACQILVLSDMHEDKDLKKAVQDYILKEGAIIFESNEWIRLMEVNLKLAAETMQKNWIKN